MFKKLKEKIKNITPKQAIIGTLAGTAGLIISAPLAVAAGAGFLAKTIKDAKDENKKEIEEKKKQLEEQQLNEQSINNFATKIDDNVIPESFICPITQNIMIDPVISPYGISYEKYAIENWLSKNNVDPFSQKPLHKEQLVRNFALKNAIREFIINFKKEHEKKKNENLNSQSGNNILNSDNNNIDLSIQNNQNCENKKIIDEQNNVNNDNIISNNKEKNNVIENNENEKNVFLDEEKKNVLFEEKNDILENEKNKESIIEKNNENNGNIIVDDIKENVIEHYNNEFENKKVNINNFDINENINKL